MDEVEMEAQEKIIYKPAGFWQRARASILDTIILGIPQAVAFSLIFHGTFWHTSNGFEATQIIEIAVAMFIVIAFWKKWEGMTPGKGIVKIRVVRLDNSELGTGQAIVRYLSYLLSALPLGLGFWMAAFRKDKRTLHDLIAKTKVIYDPKVED